MNKTPYFAVNLKKLRSNLEKLQKLEALANIKILHSIKSFKHLDISPIIANSLSGFSIGSKMELKIALKSKAKELFLYSPAFKESDLKTLSKSVDKISLNSIAQWDKFCNLSNSLGLRINPKLNFKIPSYCNPNLEDSRLGVKHSTFLSAYNKDRFKNLKGLHFHIMYSANAKELKALLEFLNREYKDILKNLEWLNLGGGYNFTSANFNSQEFISLLKEFQNRYKNLTIYFEPGEAVVKNAGKFVCSVVDIIDNIAILDTSIEAHLLDVAIFKKSLKLKKSMQGFNYTYKLTGNSCLAGDTVGTYSFKNRLEVGSKVIFEDMLAYTTVKLTNFNGFTAPPLVIEQ